MEEKKELEKTQKKAKMFYSPLKMTEALEEMGETYQKKEGIVYYSAVIVIAIILGLLFELKPIYLLVVGIVYVLFVPQLIYNQKKQAFEMQRFIDINAYMSQMANSFTRTKSILDALYETQNMFTVGRMQTSIAESIDIFVSGYIDVRTSQEAALKHIEERFDCEKLRNLHSFLLMAESRGGECVDEFTILEKVRMSWETAINDYHKKLIEVRNRCTIIYGFMLFICIIILNAFKSNGMGIGEMGMIQVLNTMMISFFIILFVAMDRRINTSLLKDAKEMTQETVDRYFAIINGTTSQKDNKMQKVVPIVCGIVVFMAFLNAPTPMTAAIGIVLMVASLNIYQIKLVMTVKRLRNEILRAFPKWLFDVMLLIQSESVASAIIHSKENAPAVLKAELNRISNALMLDPNDNDIYQSFFGDFKIISIKTCMQKLYSLSLGDSDKAVMKFILDNNKLTDKKLLTHRPPLASTKGLNKKSSKSQTIPICIPESAKTCEIPASA